MSDTSRSTLRQGKVQVTKPPVGEKWRYRKLAVLRNALMIESKRVSIFATGAGLWIVAMIVVLVAIKLIKG